MAKKTIKNIIFDFGNVLLDIDYQRTTDALAELLCLSIADTDKIIKLKHYSEKYEIGAITTENFIWNIQRLTNAKVPQGHDVIKAWNALLIGWNPTKFDLLRKLKTDFDLYLLSNTNEIHIDWAMRDLKRNHDIIDFEFQFFTKVYYSHRINLRKPNTDIYKYVEHDANILPSETLFIDDLAENVNSAASLGWNTIHHNPVEDLAETIDHWLNLNT